MTHPRPLRIMMTADAVGGVWTYATGLARELARRGHAVVLVTLGPTPRVDQLQAVWRLDGVSVEVTDLPLEWMEPEAAELPRALARLEAIARRVGPDVVHLNSFREAQGAFPAPRSGRHAFLRALLVAGLPRGRSGRAALAPIRRARRRRTCRRRCMGCADEGVPRYDHRALPAGPSRPGDP